MELHQLGSASNVSSSVLCHNNLPGRHNEASAAVYNTNCKHAVNYGST